MSVVLVDSGGANIGSLRSALQRLGADAVLASAAAAIREAEHVILPGVGAAGPAMARLRELDLVGTLRNLTQPVLGVCLGMQLLCAHSDEGDVECLGVIRAKVRRLRGGPRARVPHMGWNRVCASAPHPLLNDDAGTGWAYFVHSYAVPPGTATIATCEHGEPLSAAIGRGNFLGVQFHPERSARLGAALLRNFLAL